MALTDPYVSVSYSGVEGLTQLIYSQYNPVYFEDINFNIEIPTVTDTIIFRIMDRDIDGEDDVVGTYFLKLQSISYFSQDDYGFDPTFGPCFINFDGAPREITEHNEQFRYLNYGFVPGVAFRGRLFLEIFTKPSYSVGLFAKVQPSTSDAQAKSEKYLNRSKFVIACGFLEASIISQAESAITFEVSCGEFGNMSSSSVDATNSTTQPTQPLFDSTRYYYLNWDAGCPATLVVCELEDCIYRLETLNILEDIYDTFVSYWAGLESDIWCKNRDRAIASVDDAMQLELTDRTVKSRMKNGLKELADKLAEELPELPPISNELDRKLRSLRRMRMDKIIVMCNKLFKEVAPDRDCYGKMLRIQEKVKIVCDEPQTNIPDVVIWMIMNSVRIGYFKAPIHWFLESNTGKGKYCGVVRHINLRVLGGDSDSCASLVKCFMWFGSLSQFRA
eukprot:sb/3464672/